MYETFQTYATEIMTARADGKHIASYEGNALHLPCCPIDCAGSGAGTGKATAGKNHIMSILWIELYTLR